ncbi:MAG: sulfur oxidation c-type cytochrome SoxX [Sulfurimonadaceae bacterium]|jgi:sulfur-oxidizing protein SoxX|nr:sulfur oxidation c-type cytochrome SoxX [Sulfurimonadaceae bacterium]
MKKSLMISLLASVTLLAADYSSVVEDPDAIKIIKADLLGPVKSYKMPKECISSDPKVIARGAYIFHNLNGSDAKTTPPEGLAKKNPDGSVKQYGNCVACHNIEKAVGGGNIGPDMTNYKEVFVDSRVRDHQFVFQKIADSRVDNPTTTMTINLTTGLFNEREICDIASYVVAPK